MRAPRHSHQARPARALRPALRAGARLDVLWFKLARRGEDDHGVLGCIEARQALIMRDRGDYWQCALIIRNVSCGPSRLGVSVRFVRALLASRTGRRTRRRRCGRLHIEGSALRAQIHPGKVGRATKPAAPAPHGPPKSWPPSSLLSWIKGTNVRRRYSTCAGLETALQAGPVRRLGLNGCEDRGASLGQPPPRTRWPSTRLAPSPRPPLAMIAKTI
jgi:hypothetical protein